MGQRKCYVFSWLIKEIIMNDKSHVGMGHYVCPYCGKEHSEVVLVNKSLKDTLERENMLGFELCDEHKLLAENYVLLIGTTGNPAKDESATLTGNNAAVGRTSPVLEMFKVDITKFDYLFVEPGVIKILEELANDSESSESSDSKEA
jgi:hypothetical protein